VCVCVACISAYVYDWMMQSLEEQEEQAERGGNAWGRGRGFVVGKFTQLN